MHTIGLLSDNAPDQIPASHRDLVQCPPVAALTTVMPDGSPQTSVVWCDFDGALDHLDRLTRSYTRHPAFYGHISPAAQRWRETRVICRIHVRRLTLDAIHM